MTLVRAHPVMVISEVCINIFGLETREHTMQGWRPIVTLQIALVPIALDTCPRNVS